MCNRKGTEDIRYGAYCSKHLAAHMGKASVILNDDVDAGTSHLQPTNAMENATNADSVTNTGSLDVKSKSANLDFTDLDLI